MICYLAYKKKTDCRELRKHLEGLKAEQYFVYSRTPPSTSAAALFSQPPLFSAHIAEGNKQGGAGENGLIAHSSMSQLVFTPLLSLSLPHSAIFLHSLCGFVI